MRIQHLEYVHNQYLNNNKNKEYKMYMITVVVFIPTHHTVYNGKCTTYIPYKIKQNSFLNNIIKHNTEFNTHIHALPL